MAVPSDTSHHAQEVIPLLVGHWVKIRVRCADGIVKLLVLNIPLMPIYTFAYTNFAKLLPKFRAKTYRLMGLYRFLQ